MKTAAIILAAATAAVAKPQHALPTGAKIDCAKPNANYCMGGDIILRCDANALGTSGRCSDNVAGYPPAGGSATCYESGKEAGDAACMKNCVVYAEPAFTLAADQCQPSASNTGPSVTATGVTGIATVPEGTGSLPVVTSVSDTITNSVPGSATVPEGTGTLSSKTILTYPIASSSTNSEPTETETDDCPVSTSSTTEPSATNPAPTVSGGDQTVTQTQSQPQNQTQTQSQTQTTGTPTSGPNSGASANQALGGLALAGIVAAFLL